MAIGSLPGKAEVAGPTIEGRLRELEQRVEVLERAGRSRDAADARLRQHLAASTRGLSFRAVDLLRHAQGDEALAAALLGADVVTTGDLGCWLRDHNGLDDGVAIVRLRNRRWQVQHVICVE
jgi:hypothetical protein